MTSIIRCPRPVIEATLATMWAGGRRNCEALTLWLARRCPDRVQVVEAYEPPYEAAVDRFHILPAGMRVIMTRLRKERLYICAQVHSHPGRAFHSQADDTWAIVRHQGALSLVVPRFGADTTEATFLDTVAAYSLSNEDRWEFVPRDVLSTRIEVTDAYGAAGK
jgi:hypothetical protein